MLLSIEQHVDWLAELLARVGDVIVEARPDAEERWVAHVNERADATIYPKARSCYLGDEVPGKPCVFMPCSGGVRGNRRIMEKVVVDGYDGLAMVPAGAAVRS